MSLATISNDDDQDGDDNNVKKNVKKRHRVPKLWDVGLRRKNYKTKQGEAGVRVFMRAERSVGRPGLSLFDCSNKGLVT